MKTTGVLPDVMFLPIPHEIAERVRRERKDAFGHDVSTHRGMEPCRVCLTIATSPEEYLLMSYQPFAEDRNPYAEVGPIFIHARTCTPYRSLTEFPNDFLARTLVLRAYTPDGRIHDATISPPGEGARIAAEFLSDPDVAEVHVRHTTYTCYDFKIVRQ